ncbi:hypothetical protein SLEP1_g25544 [Rubroshorea leprosula]|uniref:Uncharacterized protein n=1 Tax=Rubroshorea leprosula TaxID=152421 RepID=A0AAV5JTK9_9ROSI|nr:hypothetical protein SLEP1_g25544 [Rubroshorea leprosula]
MFFASHAAFSLYGQTVLDYGSLIGMAALHFDNLPENIPTRGTLEISFYQSL